MEEIKSGQTLRESSYFEITNEEIPGNDSDNDPVEIDLFGNCKCKATVLLVDDQPFNLVPLKMMLRDRLKIKCDFGEDGMQEVSMFERNQSKTCCNVRYRLILTDLNMPKMDGFDAAKKILEY